jgi:hypothetical protein
MDYTIEILRKCKAHGFKVYLNPHQDIASFLTKNIATLSDLSFSGLVFQAVPERPIGHSLHAVLIHVHSVPPKQP